MMSRWRRRGRQSGRGRRLAAGMAGPRVGEAATGWACAGECAPAHPAAARFSPLIRRRGVEPTRVRVTTRVQPAAR